MVKYITALTVYFEQSPSRPRWSAWFAATWIDGSMSTWTVDLPTITEDELPGLPDWKWMVGLLSMAAKRHVSPGDILVTPVGPAEWDVQLVTSQDVPVPSARIGSTESDGDVSGNGQPELPFGDVSRETDA